MSDGFQRPPGVAGSVMPGGELCRKTVKVGGGRSLGGTRKIPAPPGEVGAIEFPPPPGESRVGVPEVGATTRWRFIPRAAASSCACCSADRFGGTLDLGILKTWAGPIVAE